MKYTIYKFEETLKPLYIYFTYIQKYETQTASKYIRQKIQCI